MREVLILVPHAGRMTITRGHLTTTTALLLALGLSACGADDGTTGEGSSPSGAASPSAEASSGADDTGSADDSDDDETAAEDDEAASDDADDTAGSASTMGDTTAAGLAAIATAEDEAGGEAMEIDDSDDDGTWEIEVRAGDRVVEVDVSADGAEVLGTEEDDLDDDDAAALDAAQVSLAEAVEAAVADAGGMLDDASLEDEDGAPRFEVSLDGSEAGEDVEVLVDAVTGEVTGRED